MAVRARYTKPLQVVETPETRERIRKLSDDQDVSQAEIIRQAIAIGLPELERRAAAGS